MNIILKFYIFYPSKTSVSILKVRGKALLWFIFFLPSLWFVSETMGIISLWHWEALIVVTVWDHLIVDGTWWNVVWQSTWAYLGVPSYRQQRGPRMWFLHGLSSKLWRMSYLWIIFKGWIYSKTVRVNLFQDCQKRATLFLYPNHLLLLEGSKICEIKKQTSK